jgi:Kelch motif/Galactose oxidase, central domain
LGSGKRLTSSSRDTSDGAATYVLTMTKAFAVVAVAVLAAGAAGWQKRAPMPSPRSEVAAAPFQGAVAILGGFSPGRVSKRADLYLPKRNRWRALPDLPVAANHAMAASAGGKLYVVGGYATAQNPFLRTTLEFDGRRWRRLAPLPQGRAAGGAGIVDGKLYVVGGVAPTGLAETAFVLDLQSGAWSAIRGPSPREHLSAFAHGGKLYVLGGRLGGVDSNLDTFEAYSSATGRWETLPPEPEPRGGAGLALADGLLVSVGGEGPDATTIGKVYGYDLAGGVWRRLPDLPTPRHGLAVVGIRGKVYAIGGSPVADLGFSTANEALDPVP